ncbi:MAG: hypothetical protein OXH04_05915 [Acidobacteria bacterium]|nr:hypothetical protein [Acidobacteriota bacterium]
MVVARPAPAARVRESFAVHPVVALTGPRQCGKTTLARSLAADFPGSTYFDLEAAVDRRRLGFECKRSDAPGVTRSMRVACGDLGLERLWIVYPGDESYPLDDRISVLPVADIPGVAAMLGR